MGRSEGRKGRRREERARERNGERPLLLCILGRPTSPLSRRVKTEEETKDSSMSERAREIEREQDREHRANRELDREPIERASVYVKTGV